MALLGWLEFYSARNALACIALVVLLWLWLRPKRQAERRGFRWLGRMENVMHSIVTTCGHMNVVAVLQFASRFDGPTLQLALKVLQRRHAVLRSHLASSGGHAALQEMQPELCTGIPLAGVHRSTPDEWQRVLESELNVAFLPRVPALRCTLLQTADQEGSDVVLTARHDVMDATTLVHLAEELLAVYSALIRAEENRRPNRAISQPQLALSGDTVTRLTQLEILQLPEPISPPVDVLSPNFLAPFDGGPGLLLFGKHLWHLVKQHALRLPDSLANTSQGHEGPQAGRWATGVQLVTLSVDGTAKLLARCRQQGVDLQSLVFVSVLVALAQYMDEAGMLRHPESHLIRLWGLMQVDLRPKQSSHGLSQHSLGLLMSFLDFVLQLDRSADLADPERMWQFARQLREDLRTSLDGGKHLCSLVFTEKISSFFSIYSKYFATPKPCPAFVFCPVPDVDKRLFEAAESRQELENVFIASSSATSYPMPLVTSLVQAGSLHCSLTYSKATTCAAAMQSVADGMHALLDALAR